MRRPTRYKNNTYIRFSNFSAKHHKTPETKNPLTPNANFANSPERNKQVFHNSENLLKNFYVNLALKDEG